MALFGPQARLERCLWWANLTGWPNGISDERRGRCYDRVFGGRTTGGTSKNAANLEPLKSEKPPAVKPKNDLLTVAVVVLGAWLIWKYVLKK
jgi:hypothetical protein